MTSHADRTRAKLKDVGEFGLIDLIKKGVFSSDKRVLVDIGDDAAVIKSSPERFLIFTTDTLLERIHFDLRYFTFEEVGWKAMAANLSDIAAMGGLPTFALVTIGLPKSTRVRDVLAIYKGASKIAGKHNCKVIGGDTTLVPKDLIVSIALLGEVEKENLVTRGGAKKGDLICVTGRLGEARAGLESLKKHGRRKRSLVRRHLKPEPRIDEARTLVRSLKINSMIDISDGLSSELFHLTEESGLGAVVREKDIPISPKCLRPASQQKRSPLGWALTSGEEYELLFTVDRKDQSRIDRVRKKVDFSVIGEMVEKRQGVRLTQKSGKSRDLSRTGFVHF
ncbi:MAG: thiamine-phosphate kinase [Candidatus Zixiibacteriota bacterium]|nr:MAG: thiamine-phosphate kinase [candidate division Zixibacteria bacterium]